MKVTAITEKGKTMAKTENIRLRVLAVELVIRGRKRVTLRQIQDEIERRFDFRPKRETLYKDLAAIDRIYPIYMEKKDRKVFYSFMEEVKL